MQYTHINGLRELANEENSANTALNLTTSYEM